MRNKVIHEETFWKRVYQFFGENKSKGKSFTVKHFEAEGYKRSSLYRIIKRSEDGISAEWKWCDRYVMELPSAKQSRRLLSKKDQKRSNILKQTEAQIRQVKACVSRMCKIYRNIDRNWRRILFHSWA